MADQENAAGHNPHVIVRIFVEKLFGQFTYELPMKDDPADVSSLFLLYGDNGSGKTTILNMLFRMLSCIDGKGYKNSLRLIKFKRFRVELAGGIVVDARRGSDKLDGPFTATILQDTEPLQSIEIPHEGGTSEEQRMKERNFLEILSNLGLSLNMLPDNRRMQSGFADDPRALSRQFFLQSGEIVRPIASSDPEESDEQEELKKAVASAARWVRQQAYKGSNIGQKNVNAMYTEIAHSIAASPTDAVDEMEKKMDELVDKLKGLSKKSEAYSRFGLISELRVEEMNESLKSKVSPANARIMYNVIDPYVRSIEKQLNALEGIHNIINTFVNNLNKFFAGSKTIGYELRKGFTIKSKTGDRLNLDMLSSGEKHLMFLMCNTLVARDKASILIIDEPEISLNIKWQRRLVRALLDCIKGSGVQLVFATHSIELLAQHKDHVIRLNNLEEQVVHDTSKSGTNGRRSEDNPRVNSEV